MFSSLPNMPSTTSVLSTYTSFTVSAMLVRTVVNEVQAMIFQLIPKQLQDKILSKLGGLWRNSSSSSQMTLYIHESIHGYPINQMFEASELYLSSKISPSVERLTVSKAPNEKQLCVTTNPEEQIVDTFQGIQLTWHLKCTTNKSQKASPDYNDNDDDDFVEFDDFDDDDDFYSERNEGRLIELDFDKKDREMVLSSYLPFVLERSKAMEAENKVMKLHLYGGGCSSVNLDHPSTFETLAMDPTLKKEIIDDLDRFVKRREFYRRVGKAWKRGYLLYGPPGTGKSSLIAAIANYLNFNIYDVELTSLWCNSDLRSLLVSTANQSILVIEDIDCSINFQNRQDEGYDDDDDDEDDDDKQLSLSGLLNFTDGLWSSCGDEKIIIFTTNHKNRLDPALLRPGRMDMHIHMSYCTPCGFKILAANYLGINNHSMFTEIEKLVTEVEVTPAKIAEELMKSEDADMALGELIKFLHMKKAEHEKAIAEGEKEDNEQAKENPRNKEEDEEKKEEGEKGKNM